jgi:hypothetical protein
VCYQLVDHVAHLVGAESAYPAPDPQLGLFVPGSEDWADLIMTARSHEFRSIVRAGAVDERINCSQQRQPAGLGSIGDLERQIGLNQDRQLLESP